MGVRSAARSKVARGGARLEDRLQRLVAPHSLRLQLRKRKPRLPRHLPRFPIFNGEVFVTVFSSRSPHPRFAMTSR